MNGEYIRGKYLDIQNEQKNRYTFLGILQGVTCDGNITIREVEYILSWLNQHDVKMESFPLFDEIEKLLIIMSKKQIIVDYDETKLKNMLNDLSGNSWEKTKDTVNMPINLYSEDIEINFNGSTFVLTGNFSYGSKKECEEIIISLGGICANGVTNKTDYLIVGKNGSKDWTHNSWGNKIEKASNLEVLIISEEYWLKEIKKIIIKSY